MMKTGKFLAAAVLLAAVLAFAACGDSGDSLNDPPEDPPPGGSESSNIELAWIPAGSFQMGSPASEPYRGANEQQHQVTLTKGFWMGVYPVTQGQYQKVMGSNPSHFTSAPGGGSRDGLPVEKVSWYDALVFCNRLSISEGLTPAYSISGSTNPAAWGTVPTTDNATWNAVTIVSGSTGYRLPTEAQWEYASRAGTTTPFGIGDGTKLLAGMANFWDQYTYNLANNSPGHKDEGAVSSSNVGQTSIVGDYAANAWGLYDMPGNVWEWCWDWFGSYPSDAQTDPTGAVTGGNRVVRGGSWNDNAQYARSA